MNQRNKIVIAVDLMGGDNSPISTLHGVELALKSLDNVEFLLFGDQAQLKPILDKLTLVKKHSELIHTEHFVSPEEKPSNALRYGKETSMRLAIDAVKNNQAHAVVSAGNTGALMAMAKVILRTLPTIDRPAIAALMPTLKGKSVMLDLGANAECTANQLLQFAVMGNAFAKILLNKPAPTIGLLNIGSEEAKGNDIVKYTASLLRENPAVLNFIGYIEGNDIAKGTVDVIVTDGFTGNVALKTAEGTAQISKIFLKEALTSSFLGKIAGFLARRSLKKLAAKLDPRNYNGALFVGVNGIVVKSHGFVDHIGFCNAIKVATELAREKINEEINLEISFILDSTNFETEI